MAEPVTPSAEGDSALARRFRDGDMEALGELYLRHFPSVYQTVGPRIGDPSAAEDVAQAAFLRAWEQRSRLRDPRKFRPWLLALARHLALDARRRRLRDPIEEARDGVAADRPETEAIVTGNETAQLVWRAVASLEPRYQEVLQLVVRDQLKNRELAVALGVSTAHAAVLVHRARRAFEVAVRTLLLATQGRDCPRLQELVPAGLSALSAADRARVDRHMRRCAHCRAAADRLTEPSQLFDAWPLLALPTGWNTTGLHATMGHLGAASVPKASAWPRHALQAGAAGTAAAAIAVGALMVHGRGSPPPTPSAPAPSATPVAGRIFITGDDPDVHAHYGPNTAGARHVIQEALRLVTRGKASPRILLVTDLREPGVALHGDPRLGLHDAGYNPDVADDGSGAPGVLDLRTVRFAAYDAVVVASDFGGWLRQSELDILDARRADLAAYTRAGGGVVAFAEGGAAATPGSLPLTSHGYFGFLPASWGVAPLSEYQVGVTVTSAGAAVGLSSADEAGNYLHAAFSPPPGATVLVTDSRGRAIAFWMPVVPAAG